MGLKLNDFENIIIRSAIIAACIIIILASCTTQRKAEKYFNSHVDKAAEYCANKFPVIPHVDSTTTIDSTGFWDAFNALYLFADSLLQAGKDTVKIPVEITREVVREKIKRELAPCVEKVVTVRERVIDSARQFILQDKIAGLDKLVREKENDIQIIDSKRDWWKKIAIWGLGINCLLLVWIFRKPIIRLIGL